MGGPGFRLPDRLVRQLDLCAAAGRQGCIDGHLKKAMQSGATPEEISETISIAAAINAAAIIDLTDVAAANLNINHFPSDGPRFRG